MQILKDDTDRSHQEFQFIGSKQHITYLWSLKDLKFWKILRSIADKVSDVHSVLTYLELTGKVEVGPQSVHLWSQYLGLIL